MTTSSDKRFKLPILTKANHRQWFNQAKTSLEAQDIEHVLESDTPGSTPFAAPQSDIDQQAKQFKKDNANAKLILLTGLDEFDQEDVEEMPKCQAIWKYLKTKYTDTRATTVLSLLRDLTTYTMKEDQKIADTWNDIKNKRRHLKQINDNVAKAFTEDQLFQILLESLPDAYSSLADSMRSSAQIDINEKIQKLQDKEDSLTKTDVAMIAYRRSFRSKSRKDSSCYLCDGSHFFATCKYLKKAQIYIEKEKRKDRRKHHERYSPEPHDVSSQVSDATQPSSEWDSDKSVKRKSKKSFKKDNKKVSKRNRQRAYIADSDLSDSQEYATYAVAEPRSDVNSKDIDYCFSSMENKWIPIRKGGLQRLDIDPHETNNNKWFRTSPPC